MATLTEVKRVEHEKNENVWEKGMSSQAEVCRRSIRHSKEERRAKLPMALWGPDQGRCAI